MRFPAAFAFIALCLLGAFGVASVPESQAQRDVDALAPEDAQAQLERATRESQRAQARADRFQREAESEIEAAERTAREAAAIAAQIQVAEADIEIARARYALAQSDRAALSDRLTERRQPLVRLTAALQTSARRPLALSALQPGSLKDLVYVRAVLDSAVPEIQRRTSALREELEEGLRLEREAARAIIQLGESEDALRARRAELTEIETRQRLASQDARSNAVREGERALALAEEARDLDTLIDRIDEAATLRRELASLPGPILRPDTLDDAVEMGVAEVAEVGQIQEITARPPAGFQLPVQGRTVTGFGELRESGLRSTGLSLAPSPRAQIVAPANGRIAFSGPYRGFGRIVIIEHPGGWTSLVTGLERANVSVGETVIGGAPLGTANAQEPVVTIELRQSGEPVNPLNFLR